MDVIDKACELEQMARDHHIRAATKVHRTLAPTGHCHFCDEPVDRLFCSPECRDGWEAEDRARQRNQGSRPWD